MARDEPMVIPIMLTILAGIAEVRWEQRYAQAAPEIQQWYRDQVVPGGAMRCCDDSDGETVSEEIREGRYWITGEHFPMWTPVPPDRVLMGPNKVGHPVVWWARQGDVVFIRCYAPGPGI